MEVHPIGNEEVDAFIRANNVAFGNRPDPSQVARQRRELTELDRTLGAYVAGQLAGTAAALSSQLTVPGPVVVPMAGVTWVGVAPTHRRRGLLRALMGRQLADIHARGEALAGLGASEGGIYGRWGYGGATRGTTWMLERARGALEEGADDGGAVELTDADLACEALAQVHDEVRRRRPGDVAPCPTWWEEAVEDEHQDRHGSGAKLFVLRRDASGLIDGAAVYRVVRERRWSDDATVQVDHLEAASPVAYRALWAYLVDLDLTRQVAAAGRPLDEPLRHLLADPRQLRVTKLYDWLWLRLVDVPAALEARRYAAEGRLVLEVTDRACPWNAGRWLLDGGPGGAECRRARPGEDPGLVLGASGLGSAYLGGVGLASLAYAGRVAELVPGALGRACAMLAVDPAPFCSSWF